MYTMDIEFIYYEKDVDHRQSNALINNKRVRKRGIIE